MSRSLTRFVDILDCFTVQRPSASMTEIAELTGLDKSTAHRLLSAMEAARILRRDVDSKHYALGAKIMEWGTTAVESIDLHSLADPWLRRLNQETQQTVELYLRDHDHRIRIAGYESPQPIRLVHPVGFTLPITRGAGGKVTLAALPDVEAQALVDGDDELTPAEREQLISELVAVRKRGYAVDVTYQMPSALSLAAAIRDRSGVPVATIVVSWLSTPNDHRFVEQFAESVLAATREISQAFGA